MSLKYHNKSPKTSPKETNSKITNPVIVKSNNLKDYLVHPFDLPAQAIIHSIARMDMANAKLLAWVRNVVVVHYNPKESDILNKLEFESINAMLNMNAKVVDATVIYQDNFDDKKIPSDLRHLGHVTTAIALADSYNRLNARITPTTIYAMETTYGVVGSFILSALPLLAIDHVTNGKVLAMSVSLMVFARDCGLDDIFTSVILKEVGKRVLSPFTHKFAAAIALTGYINHGCFEFLSFKDKACEEIEGKYANAIKTIIKILENAHHDLPTKVIIGFLYLLVLNVGIFDDDDLRPQVMQYADYAIIFAAYFDKEHGKKEFKGKLPEVDTNNRVIVNLIKSARNFELITK